MRAIQLPILDPININFFLFFIFALMSRLASLDHLDIFPSINFPDDFPCPEYSNVKNPIFFFLQYFRNVDGFSPVISDIKP